MRPLRRRRRRGSPQIRQRPLRRKERRRPCEWAFACSGKGLPRLPDAPSCRCASAAMAQPTNTGRKHHDRQQETHAPRLHREEIHRQGGHRKEPLARHRERVDAPRRQGLQRESRGCAARRTASSFGSTNRSPRRQPRNASAHVGCSARAFISIRFIKGVFIMTTIEAHSAVSSFTYCESCGARHASRRQESSRQIRLGQRRWPRLHDRACCRRASHGRYTVTTENSARLTNVNNASIEFCIAEHPPMALASIRMVLAAICLPP